MQVSSVPPRSSSRYKQIGMLVFALAFLIAGGWGMFDSNMWGSGQKNVVAWVGQTPIKMEDIHRKVSDILTQYPSFPALQVHDEALTYMVNNVALYEYAKSQGLRVTEQQIIAEIQKQGIFQNPQTQKFDRSLYEQFLKSYNMTEEDFVKDIRILLLNTLFSNAMSPQSYKSSEIAKILYGFEREKRSIQMLTFNTAFIAKDVSAITPEEIETYYKENQSRFSVPERRTLDYISLSFADIYDKTVVSDDELKTYYDAHKEKFVVAEKRNLYQFSFPDKDKAIHAIAQLKNSQDIVKTASELGFAPKDIELGQLQKTALPKDIGETVFSLKQGDITEPFDTPFGWVIYSIQGVNSQHIASLDEVKTQLTTELKQKKASEALEKLIHDMDEAFAGGLSLDKVAGDHGLTVSKLQNISVTGIEYQDNKPKIPSEQDDKDKKPQILEDEEFKSKLIKDAFALEQGTDPVLSFDEQKKIGVFYKVSDVKPVFNPPLEDVKTLVEQAVTTHKEIDALDKKVEELYKKVAQKETTLDKLSSEFSLKLETRSFLPTEYTGFLGKDSLGKLFSAPLGTPVIGKDMFTKKEQVIAIATEIMPADLGTDEAKKIIEKKENEFSSNELMSIMSFDLLQKLTSTGDVKINPDMLKQSRETLENKLKR